MNVKSLAGSLAHSEGLTNGTNEDVVTLTWGIYQGFNSDGRKINQETMSAHSGRHRERLSVGRREENKEGEREVDHIGRLTWCQHEQQRRAQTIPACELSSDVQHELRRKQTHVSEDSKKLTRWCSWSISEMQQSSQERYIIRVGSVTQWTWLDARNRSEAMIIIFLRIQ